MNRLFGAKNTAPKPTLQGAIGNVSPPTRFYNTAKREREEKTKKNVSMY